MPASWYFPEASAPVVLFFVIWHAEKASSILIIDYLGHDFDYDYDYASELQYDYDYSNV